MSASIFTDQHDTRELWLWRAIENYWRGRINGMILLDGSTVTLPEKLHVSVGFSMGSRQENAKTRAVCWKRCVSADDVNHIFISPALIDTAQILLTLGHELIHAALDCEDGHRGRFAEIATRLGFVGSMTSSEASSDLAADLMVLAAELGDYPHGQFKVSMVMEAPKVPISTRGGSFQSPKLSTGGGDNRNRQLKLVCPEHTGYIVRASKKVSETPPACGLCASEGTLTMMILA